MLRLSVLATALALLTASAASAATRHAVPGWRGATPGSVAVAPDGRGVAVFVQGARVLAAQIDARGRVRRTDELRAPGQREVADDPLVAIDARGRIVATWGSGERRAIRPLVARFTWGERPGAATALVSGEIHTRFNRLAMSPDGTAAVLFTQGTIGVTDEDERVALIRPGQEPQLLTLERSTDAAGPLNPIDVGVDAAGGFHAAWAAGYALNVHLARSAPGAAGFGPVAALPGNRQLAGAGNLLVDGAGNDVLLWQRRGHSGDFELRTATVAAGSDVPGPAAVVSPLDRNATVPVPTIDDAGHAWFVWRAGHSVWLVQRDPDGTLQPRERLSASTGGAGWRVVVTAAARAAGVAIAAYDVDRRIRFDLDVTRLTASGERHRLARFRGCFAPRVAVAPNGRTLTAMACGKRQLGFVAAL